MSVYKVHVTGGFHVPCFESQDEALALALQYPVGTTLMWDGIDQVSPCWMRVMKGEQELFMPAFALQAGDQHGLVVLLMSGEEVNHQFVLALAPIPVGQKAALVNVINGKVGPTLLGPEENPYEE